ncbi:hypothetical protein CR513_22034, partial [Mucuna pruriens]
MNSAIGPPLLGCAYHELLGCKGLPGRDGVVETESTLLHPEFKILKQSEDYFSCAVDAEQILLLRISPTLDDYLLPKQFQGSSAPMGESQGKMKNTQLIMNVEITPEGENGNISTLALPLSKLLQKDVEFNFDQPCIEALQELKSRLTSAPILQAPNWDLPFELMCDASNSTLGAVLGQRAGAG